MHVLEFFFFWDKVENEKKKKNFLLDDKILALLFKKEVHTYLSLMFEFCLLNGHILIQLLLFQLKNVTGKVPPDACDSGSLSTLHLQVENFLDACAAQKEKMDDQGDVARSDLSEISKNGNESKATISNGRDLKAVEEGASSQKMDGGGDPSMLPSVVDGDKIVGVLSPRDISQQNPETSLKSPKPPTLKAQNSEVHEVVEQFQPGVYITLAQFPNGVRAFKRVKFR